MNKKCMKHHVEHIFLVSILHLSGCTQILPENNPISDSATIEVKEKIRTIDDLIFTHAEFLSERKENTVNLLNLTITEIGETIQKSPRTTCNSQRQSKLVKDAPQVSIDFVDADLREVLIELSILINIPIAVDDTVEGFITANLENVSLKTALNIILASGNYSYRAMDDYVIVGSSLPDGPVFSQLSFTCRYKPNDISPIDLATSLMLYHQQFIHVPKNSSYLTITAPANIQLQIQNSLKALDLSPGQVLIEMTVVELSHSAMEFLGVKWDKLGRDPNTLRLRPMGAGEWNGITQQRAEDATDAFTVGLLPARTFAEALQFMTKDGSAHIMAMPSIVSVDGKEAYFSSTHSVLLPELSATTSRTGVRMRELTYGVEMKIVPRISNDGYVTLNIIDVSVSDLTENDRGFPIVTSHKISNTVKVKHGDYLVLGGLLQTKKRMQHNGLPTVKNIPFLGALFGKRDEILEEMEVLIMLRPRILRI